MTVTSNRPCIEHKCTDCGKELETAMEKWVFPVTMLVVVITFIAMNYVFGDAVDLVDTVPSCKYTTEEQGFAPDYSSAVKRTFFDCEYFKPLPK